ncbi:hypothetical protein DPEC_G00061780 [Dallia pectoralis]|uniref:Uncharacterized protein n=1 Tax=Dallia pectoralis TaxID=75939 RepID=A0ACC2H776_DALPE|nr:hypothetical protein DPEC_G00061780 [Dallia pectoralis]
MTCRDSVSPKSGTSIGESVSVMCESGGTLESLTGEYSVPPWPLTSLDWAFVGVSRTGPLDREWGISYSISDSSASPIDSDPTPDDTFNHEQLRSSEASTAKPLKESTEGDWNTLATSEAASSISSLLCSGTGKKLTSNIKFRWTTLVFPLSSLTL